MRRDIACRWFALLGKDDLRVTAFGEVDELNCVLGLARA